MHKSRLGTFVIDCRIDAADDAARLWSTAPGRTPQRPAVPTDAGYRDLEGPAQELEVRVQAVDPPSGGQIDIETDDLEAEVRRLEPLGARCIAHVKRQWVMETPTGQRLRLVRPQRPDFAKHANAWPGDEGPGPV
jgi:hypothetical protein